MTPEEAAVLTAQATAAAVAVSLLIGVVSIVLVGRANRNAKRANQLAKDAIATSNRALELSTASNAIAVDANDISTRANGLANEANEISRSNRDRDTERNDVDWDGQWREPGVYVLTNSGQDTAHKVHAVVTVDDEVVIAEADAVPRAGQIALLFPTALSNFRVEQREEAERLRREKSDAAYGLAMLYQPPRLPSHQIAERINWRSEMDSPKLHDKHFNLCTLSP